MLVVPANASLELTFSGTFVGRWNATFDRRNVTGTPVQGSVAQVRTVLSATAVTLLPLDPTFAYASQIVREFALVNTGVSPVTVTLQVQAWAAGAPPTVLGAPTVLATEVVPPGGMLSMGPGAATWQVGPASLLPPSAGIGTYVMALSSPGPDYLITDGLAISRWAHAVLFALMGTAFGAGNGTTTFNLPDTRGRIAMNIGGAFALGGVGGAATVTLTTAQMPAHVHTSGFGAGATVTSGAGTLGQTATGSEGGGGPHENMPPYVTLGSIWVKVL